jgi:hypothetical protein
MGRIGTNGTIGISTFESNHNCPACPGSPDNRVYRGVEFQCSWAVQVCTHFVRVTGTLPPLTKQKANGRAIKIRHGGGPISLLKCMHRCTVDQEAGMAELGGWTKRSMPRGAKQPKCELIAAFLGRSELKTRIAEERLCFQSLVA